jgi:hypothetical protein
MTQKIGILYIHGMGQQKVGFSDQMDTELLKKLKSMGYSKDRFASRPIWWAPLLDNDENTLHKRIVDNNPVGLKDIRRFTISALGDPLAYLDRKEAPNSMYKRIHGMVHTAIKDLITDIGENSPIVVIGGSLGTMIMTDYIYDVQKYREGAGRGTSPVELMDTLCGIFTFGCNIPLFTFTQKPVDCITFPPQKLDERLKPEAKWLNFYDKQDVLGLPLKQVYGRLVGDNFITPVNEDIKVTVDGVLTGWNPGAHVGYWTTNDVIKPIAERIAKIADVLDGN